MEASSPPSVEAEPATPAPEQKPEGEREPPPGIDPVLHRDIGEWHGMQILDRDGERIGALEEIYVDVETDEPQFATIKEGFFGRHLTFVPLSGITIGPEYLQVPVTREQVKSAPTIALRGDELDQADESALYHHFGQNYSPPNTASGRRLARRS
jgi:hypothetical protein